MTDKLLLAEIHLRVDAEISKIGTHRFLAKPAIGEEIMVGKGANELTLTVYAITHIAVPMDEQDWNGLIVLNCEIAD